MIGVVAPTIWRLPKETKEWIGPITVTADGAVITGWQIALIADGLRPSEADWHAADQVGIEYGVMIGEGSNYPSLSIGSYLLWVRFDNGTEKPVVFDFAVIIIE